MARYNRRLSVAFIDIDHFKTVNDTHGHEAGDLVLRGVADILRTNTRQTDLVGRYGGEEFVIVLPETSPEDAAAIAEKLRRLVLKERFSCASGAEIAVSVSIGIAGGQAQQIRVDQLLRDADAAMYSAKSLGRNQTYVFAELDDDNARIPRAAVSSEGRARAAAVGDLARQAANAALSAVVSPLPHYRGRPSPLIAEIAVRLARELQLPDAEIDRIRIASLLHDIGKVGVPEENSREARTAERRGMAVGRSAFPHRPTDNRADCRRPRGRRDHPAPPRALLRPRLPLRPAWYGDTARCPHRCHRRCVRRHGPRPALQPRDRARGRHRGTATLRGPPVRSGTGGTVLLAVCRNPAPAGHFPPHRAARRPRLGGGRPQVAPVGFGLDAGSPMSQQQ